MPNNQSSPSYSPEDPEFNLFVGVISTVISLLFTCLQYWKPNWWWDTPKARIFKSIVGEQFANIFGYTAAIAWMLAGIYFFYTAKQKFEERSRNNSTENE